MSHEPFLAVAVMALFWFALAQRPASHSGAPSEGTLEQAGAAGGEGRGRWGGPEETARILVNDPVGEEIETVQIRQRAPQAGCWVCEVHDHDVEEASSTKGGHAPRPTQGRVNAAVATTPVGSGLRQR